MHKGIAANAAPPTVYLGYRPAKRHPARARVHAHAREKFTASIGVQADRRMALGVSGPHD